MIHSAEEFKRLRTSENLEDQRLAATSSADLITWLEVIERFPDLREWVAQNKTVPLEILEILATDKDVNVRCVVARKRKINRRIFDLLKSDPDETVRYSLLINTKLSDEFKSEVYVADSEWLRKELKSKTGANKS